MPSNRPPPGTHPGRWAAAVLLVAAAAAAALLLLDGGGRQYRLVFANAAQLVKGDLVRIGGVESGTVRAVDLSADSRAVVLVELDRDVPRLHDGTTATIRAASLTGVANRYVDISPAPNFRRVLPKGATIAGGQTQSVVEIDQLLSAFDAPTREGMRRLVRGFGDWYAGREPEANRSARYFAPALGQWAALAREIERDSGSFEDFIVQTGAAMGTLAERRDDLTGLVGNTRATARAIAADTRSLTVALEQLPPALREGSDAMVALRPAVEDLRGLVAATRPAARDLPGFMRELTPVIQRSVPAFGRLREMFARPGASNDLLDALRDLPPLARQSGEAFPRARRALEDSTPMMRFIRPYIPDLVGWLAGFGGVAATYDANGHYVRTQPVFDAFEFVDDSAGGRLEPKPPDLRGRSANLSAGNLRRCPGAAGPAPDDGSAPFVDSGPDANADCDPTQAIGGRR